MHRSSRGSADDAPQRSRAPWAQMGGQTTQSTRKAAHTDGANIKPINQSIKAAAER
jgi:hypothetical protein